MFTIKEIWKNLERCPVCRNFANIKLFWLNILH